MPDLNLFCNPVQVVDKAFEQNTDYNFKVYKNILGDGVDSKYFEAQFHSVIIEFQQKTGVAVYLADDYFKWTAGNARNQEFYQKRLETVKSYLMLYKDLVSKGRIKKLTFLNPDADSSFGADHNSINGEIRIHTPNPIFFIETTLHELLHSKCSNIKLPLNEALFVINLLEIGDRHSLKNKRVEIKKRFENNLAIIKIGIKTDPYLNNHAYSNPSGVETFPSLIFDPKEREYPDSVRREHFLRVLGILSLSVDPNTQEFARFATLYDNWLNHHEKFDGTTYRARDYNEQLNHLKKISSGPVYKFTSEQSSKIEEYRKQYFEFNSQVKSIQEADLFTNLKFKYVKFNSFADNQLLSVVIFVLVLSFPFFVLRSK